MRRPVTHAVWAHACGEQTEGEEAQRKGNDQVFHVNSLSNAKLPAGYAPRGRAAYSSSRPRMQFK